MEINLQLRPYQIDAIERLRDAIRQGMRRPLLVSPTGSGKTPIACGIMQAAVDKGKKCLFLAPARELINQCSDKLWQWDIPHGIIMAGRGYNLSKPVQVASKDTIISRAFHRDVLELPPADLLIIDEAHLSLADGYRRIMDAYPHAVVCGATATPCRADNRGMGDFYQTIVQAATYKDLIAQGFLVPTRVYAPHRPDLKGVKTTAGDYNKAQLEKAMNKDVLVGDIVAYWKKLAENRSTFVFASGINHSMHIRDAFLSAGVPCEHMDAETPSDVREGMFKRLQARQTLVLTNVAVLCLGIDQPIVSCCVIARPTKSFGLWRQIAGRTMRPCPSIAKKDCLLIDHSGGIFLHGFPDDDVDWILSESQKMKVEPNEKKPLSEQLTCCPQCSCMYRGPQCPECGYKPIKKQKTVEANKSGKLVEVRRQTMSPMDFQGLQRRWHRALAIAGAKSMTCGAAAAIFNKDTGQKPWDVSGMRNMPGRSQWRLKVADVFPQYAPRQKEATL